MIVETTGLGARTADTHDVPAEPGRRTLGEVLRALTEYEVAGYEQRRSDAGILRALSPADLVEGAARGSYGNEQRTRPKAPSQADAWSRVQEAFGDELFLVFVDGAPVDSLDAEIIITAQTRLRLVRLVALTGA